MSGTIFGSVDHSNAAVGYGATPNQELFTTIFKFFNGPLRSASYVEPVALNTGSSGTGTNFHDETNPFGENAFFCFRFVTGSISGSQSKRTANLYVLFQWADTVAFGTAPGNPGLLVGSNADGIGMSAAFRADGGNPWNGTTNFNGNDTKGGLVWNSGSSTVYAFPRSNADGGTHAANKHNMMRLGDIGNSVSNRWHMVADRDNFIFLIDLATDMSYEIIALGVYDPPPTLSGTFVDPVFAVHSTLPFTLGSSYGDTAGTSTTLQGGIHGTSGSVQVRGMRFDRYSTTLLNDTTLQPNTQYALANYDEFKLPMIMYENADKGFLGFCERITEVYNASTHDVTSDGSRAVFGNATVSTIKIVTPWSGSAPGSSSSRAGRQF